VDTNADTGWLMGVEPSDIPAGVTVESIGDADVPERR
jgi:hypothetical protein